MTDTNIKKMKGFLFMIMAMAFITLFGKSAMAEELNSSTYSYTNNVWDEWDASDDEDECDDCDDDWDDFDDDDDWDDFDEEGEEVDDEENDDFSYDDGKSGLIFWYPGDDSMELKVIGRIPKDKRAVITIPKKIVIGDETYKVTSIGECAFSDDRRLKRVIISENIVSIKEGAFSNCKNLQKVEIKSKKLSHVGKKAFAKMKKGAKIQVPKQKKKAYKKLFRSIIAKGVKLV